MGTWARPKKRINALEVKGMIKYFFLVILSIPMHSYSLGPKILIDGDATMAKKLVTKENALLLDVRTTFEAAFSQIKGSKRIHISDLEKNIQTVKSWVDGDLSRPIVVYCAAGVRAAQAKEILQKHGFKRVMNLGGVSDWKE